MNAKPPILEIRDLTVSFGGEGRALEGVSLEAAEGSFTALVGESGSGKTVTALSVCRLVRPRQTAGFVLWRGLGSEENLLDFTEERLLDVRGKQIAYIFQDPGSSLNPVLRAGAQIEEAYRAHFQISAAKAKARTLDFLELVKIREPRRAARSFPHELSGGMRQRVMIAMALIAEPRLLIADEPTTALDQAVESEILDLLVRIQKEKRLSILFITHDLDLAAKFSAVIYVMKKGRIVERMEKGWGGFRAKDDYTQRFFAAGLSHAKPKSRIEV